MSPACKLANTSGAPSAVGRGTRRPMVAIPGRFAASASGLRHRALVVAERVAEAVFAAGGEPLVLLPNDDTRSTDRLGIGAALLLPGGGDLSPRTYGDPFVDPETYGVDERQDAFDLAAARYALAQGMPLLAICRGMQVLNVAAGGTLRQHLDPPHRDLVHTITISPGSRLAGVLRASTIEASCFHHQGIDHLGRGLVVTALAGDGVVEAVELDGAEGGDGYLFGVQWHPEDTYDRDERQLLLFAGLVEAARRRTEASRDSPTGPVPHSSDPIIGERCRRDGERRG